MWYNDGGEIYPDGMVISGAGIGRQLGTAAIVIRRVFEFFMEGFMMMNYSDILSAAASLYDGGWRSEDRDDLIEEYGLTGVEADKLCEALAEYDHQEV